MIFNKNQNVIRQESKMLFNEDQTVRSLDKSSHSGKNVCCVMPGTSSLLVHNFFSIHLVRQTCILQKKAFCQHDLALAYHVQNIKQQTKQRQTLCLVVDQISTRACYSPSVRSGTGDLTLTLFAATVSKYFFLIWWCLFFEFFCRKSLHAVLMVSESMFISKFAYQDSKQDRNNISDHG